MSYIAFAWIASISFAMVGIIGKLTSKHQVKNPWLFSFVYNFLVLCFTVPIAMYYGAGTPDHWTAIILAGGFYALFSVIYILVLPLLDVTVMMPLFNFRPVFTAFFGALFLNELYNISEYALIAVVVCAGLFVAIDEKFSLRSFFQKGTMLMIFGMLALSLMTIFMNKAINETNLWTALVWIYIVGQFCMLPIVPLFHKDLFTMKKSHIGSFVVMAVATVVGFLAEGAAVSQNVTISTIIISLPLSIIIAFAFSVIAPQLLEKHTMKVYAIRFAATAVMLGATLKLTL